jgi:hypothetical protein
VGWSAATSVLLDTRNEGFVMMCEGDSPSAEFRLVTQPQIGGLFAVWQRIVEFWILQQMNKNGCNYIEQSGAGSPVFTPANKPRRGCVWEKNGSVARDFRRIGRIIL